MNTHEETPVEWVNAVAKRLGEIEEANRVASSVRRPPRMAVDGKVEFDAADAAEAARAMLGS